MREGRVGLGGNQVVAHAAAKEKVFLQHDADLAAQMRQLDLARVDAIEAHKTLLQRVQALNQLGQRGLARAAAPDDADDGPRGYAKAGFVQRGGRGAGVAEGDCVENDFAFELRSQAAGARASLGRAVHHLAEHTHRHGGFLIVVDQSDQCDQRRADTPGDHLKRDQGADGQRVVEHLLRADDDDRHRTQFAQEVGDRVAGDGDACDAKMHADRRRRALVPQAALRGLYRQRLDSAHAVDGLDQHRLAQPFGGVQRVQVAQKHRQHRHDDRCDKRGKAQNDQRELDRVGEQDGQEYHQRNGVEAGEEKPAGEEAADLLQHLHVAVDHARRGGLEIVDR